jgi:calcium/calmodulin-dependent protein kinase I
LISIDEVSKSTGLPVMVDELQMEMLE